LLLAMLPWVLLAAQRAGWRPASALLHFAVVWLALGAAWWALRTAFAARPGACAPIAAAAMLGGDALVLSNGANTLLWQGATVAGLAVLAAAGAAQARRPFAFGAGLALQLALMHGALLLAGRYFGRLEAVPALLAALAPVPIGVAVRMPKARGRSFATGSRTAAGLLLSAALIAAAYWTSRS
jgi:hypothetical protein